MTPGSVGIVWSVSRTVVLAGLTVTVPGGRKTRLLCGVGGELDLDDI